MFSSINFLFLTSLAITSWVILCYLKHIEDQRLQEITVDFNMERAFDESGMRNTTASCRNEGYEIYLNLLCVFACIYALAKITSLTESYIVKHVHAKIPHQQQQRKPNSRRTCPKPQTPVRELKPQPQVALQMTYLEKQECELCQTEHGNRTEETSAATAIVQQRQNIFITNRHFHLNQRQVYVNEGNVKLSFQTFNRSDGGGGSGSGGSGGGNQDGGASGDFTQVWQTYLEMQKYAFKKPATPIAKSAEMANNVPLVVSTEDLMRGLL